MLVINIHKTEFDAFFYLEGYSYSVGINLCYYFKTDGFWPSVYKYVEIGNVYRKDITCCSQYYFDLKTSYGKSSVKYVYSKI
jgi:hypothetical protein